MVRRMDHWIGSAAVVMWLDWPTQAAFGGYAFKGQRGYYLLECDLVWLCMTGG
jgi:hypothetical protein